MSGEDKYDEGYLMKDMNKSWRGRLEANHNGRKELWEITKNKWEWESKGIIGDLVMS